MKTDFEDNYSDYLQDTLGYSPSAWDMCTSAQKIEHDRMLDASDEDVLGSNPKELSPCTQWAWIKRVLRLDVERAIKEVLSLIAQCPSELEVDEIIEYTCLELAKHHEALAASFLDGLKDHDALVETWRAHLSSNPEEILNSIGKTAAEGEESRAEFIADALVDSAEIQTYLGHHEVALKLLDLAQNELVDIQSSTLVDVELARQRLLHHE